MGHEIYVGHFSDFVPNHPTTPYIKNNLMKKIICLITSLCFILLISCDYEEISPTIEESITQIDSLNFINFNGLQIKHRFDTPETFLNKKSNLTVLKNTLNSIRKKNASKSGVSFKGDMQELPDEKLIVEAVKNVLHLFFMQDPMKV